MDKRQLLENIAKGTASDADRQAFQQLISGMTIPEKQQVMLQLEELMPASLPDAISDDALLETLLQQIKRARVVRMQQTIRRVSAIAAILVLILSTVYFLKPDMVVEKPVLTENRILKDVTPGTNGAILQLSDGRTIVLDTAQNGTLIGGFNKSDSVLRVGDATAVEYAVVSTPYKRKQQLYLVDGTMVWLNAGSSIRFPIAFNGNNRTVEITGEAYFEVAHDARKPFMVKVGTETVKVLGTHFNVNAYKNETAIKTTLIEGSIEMQDGIKLLPGEQYSLGKKEKVNSEQTVAWVYGLFQFDGMNLQAIMRQISRWYDVEVVYEGKPNDEPFVGSIQSNLNLSQVLRLLGKTGVKYSLDGEKLTIQY